METINLKTKININEPLSVAFGYFDGLHIAHQELFNKTLELAKKESTKSAVITMYPNPNFVLNKNDQKTSLTPLFVKEKLLEEMGFDYLFIIDFNLDTAKLTHKDFIDQFLDKLDIKNIVVGFDNRYGHKGEGTTSTIVSDFNDSVNLYVVDKLMYQNSKIGTTEILKKLDDGDISSANILLGRNYQVSGTVIHGRGLGRTINVPTANIALDYPYSLPKKGVYQAYIYIDGKKHLAIMNIGNNPTFNYTDNKSIEVHILDFDEFIYDKKVILEFVDFIREEKKFPSIDLLVEEITKNKEKMIEAYTNSSSITIDKDLNISDKNNDLLGNIGKLDGFTVFNIKASLLSDTILEYLKITEGAIYTLVDANSINIKTYLKLGFKIISISDDKFTLKYR